MPIELFATAYRSGMEIATSQGLPYTMGARVVGFGHCMMFFFAYPFNRADEDDVNNTRRALERTNEAVLAAGGIPWKAEAPAQKQIIEKMDPGTFALMERLRSLLDPKGIMNPGNWERA
jgi:glycolate oxidase